MVFLSTIILYSSGLLQLYLLRIEKSSENHFKMFLFSISLYDLSSITHTIPIQIQYFEKSSFYEQF